MSFVCTSVIRDVSFKSKVQFYCMFDITVDLIVETSTCGFCSVILSNSVQIQTCTKLINTKLPRLPSPDFVMMKNYL